jgi:hypothetical protein
LPEISAALPSLSTVCLVVHDGGYGLKGYLKFDRHTIADTALDTTREIGDGAYFAQMRLVTKMSLCSEPRISLPAKPEPNSKPCTALMLSMALPKVGMQFIKNRVAKANRAVFYGSSPCRQRYRHAYGYAVDKFYHLLGRGRVGTANDVLFAFG